MSFGYRAGQVVRPTFHTAIGPLRAGSAFPLNTEAGRFLVTCQHLFGPAGGINLPVPPHDMPRFVSHATLTSPFDESQDWGASGRFIPIAGTNADDPVRDLCVFELDAQSPLPSMTVAQPPRVGDRVALAGKMRSGAPPDQALHEGQFFRTLPDGRLLVGYDNANAHPGGTSGAPLLDRDGNLLGMHVRFDSRPDPQRLVGIFMPVNAIVEMIHGALR